MQGDLEIRGNAVNMAGQFIGDLHYNVHGQPVTIRYPKNGSFVGSVTTFHFLQILIIGHHILHGKEQRLEKPFAVLQKLAKSNLDGTLNDIEPNDDCESTANRTVLDSTVAVEHKTNTATEYTVRAIVQKRLVFKARPKPLIANVGKKV